MSIAEKMNAARDRVGGWWRARREQAAAKKQLKHHAAEQLHGHSRFFLLNIPMMATVCAAIVEVYWAVLFCVEATGRFDWNFETSFGSDQPTATSWDFAFSSALPVLIGLACATAPIVMISMVWLPVQFAMRGFGRWRRGSLIAVGLLANLLVIISGTVVMNHNRQEQVRDLLVVEQSAQQGRVALEAQRTSIIERRDALIDPSNTTLQAQAARAGVAGWDAYIETARRQAQEGTIGPQRLALIERARGSAVAVEDYQRRIDELTGQIAAAAPAAATAATVEDTTGADLNAFAQFVEVWRPPFVALICTLIGVLGAWWTLAMLEGMNPRDVLRSGWAPEELRIPDMRDQAKVTPEPMRPPREVVTDAETGEELVKVKPREYWRKRKGKPQKIEIQPDIPPDEVGVDAVLAVHSDGRIGLRSSVAGPLDVERIVNGGPKDHEHAEAQQAGNQGYGAVQSQNVSTEQEGQHQAGHDGGGHEETSEQAQSETPEDVDWSALEEPPADEKDEPADPQPEGGVEQEQADPEQHDAHIRARALLTAA